MNKPLIIVMVLLVFLVVGVVYFMNSLNCNLPEYKNSDSLDNPDICFEVWPPKVVIVD